MKYLSNLMTALSKKKIYVISETGWYYSNTLEIFFDKEKAIKYWEKVTKKKWAEINYEEYQKERKHIEGFWYYGLEEYTIDYLVKMEIESKCEDAINKESERIALQSNRIMAEQATKRVDCVIDEIIQKLYLLKGKR